VNAQDGQQSLLLLAASENGKNGGLEHCWIMTFHNILGIILPIDELHDFSEG
jgi:hypothetical protein